VECGKTYSLYFKVTSKRVRLELGKFQVPRRSILHVTVTLRRTSFRTSVVGHQKAVWSQARKFVTYDDVFLLLNYMIRSSRLNILLKFRCKTPLKGLRNLTLSLRRELRRFWGWPRGLLEDIDWNEQRAATTGKRKFIPSMKKYTIISARSWK